MGPSISGPIFRRLRFVDCNKPFWRKRMDRAFVRAKGGCDKWHDYGMTIAPYENGQRACPVPWHRNSEPPRGGDHLHAAPGDLNAYAAIAFGCPAMGKALAE